MNRIIILLLLFLNLNSFADGCSGNATFTATYDPLNCCWSFINTTNNDCSSAGICTWDFGDGSPTVTTLQGAQTVCHSYMYAGSYTVLLTYDATSCFSGAICTGNQQVTIPTSYYDDQNICFGDLTTAVSMDNNATWTNNNPSIGLPASGTGPIPSFTPVGSPGTTATINFSNTCATGSFDFTILPQFTISYLVSDYNGYNISCNGNSDGSFDLSVISGSGSYSYLWSNGATTEDLTSLSAGTYSVDITDANSCTTSTSFILTEPPLIILTSNLTIDTCNSGMAEVIVSGGVFPYNYLWTDNQITPVINNFTAEDYSVIITDANNCTISEQFHIDPALFVTPIAEFNVIPDLNIHHLYRQMDKPIFFIDKSVDELTVITNWLWEFEDGFISSEQDTRHSFAEIGDFNVTLAIETLYGCVDTITKRVIIEEFLLYIPNSFTPQNDGVNDVFLPKGIGVNVYELKIFSRWGEHFFTSDDINIGWNGTTNRKDKIAQTGVYVYLINVTDVFGEKHTYNGKVTLIK